MELSPFWEASRFSASQEIPRILWNPQVHCRIHKCHHLSLTWARSVQSTPSNLTSRRSMSILSSHLRLGLPCGLFPSGFPINALYTPLLSPYMLYAPPTSFFSISYVKLCMDHFFSVSFPVRYLSISVSLDAMHSELKAASLKTKITLFWIMIVETK